MPQYIEKLVRVKRRNILFYEEPAGAVFFLTRKKLRTIHFF